MNVTLASSHFTDGQQLPFKLSHLSGVLPSQATPASHIYHLFLPEQSLFVVGIENALPFQFMTYFHRNSELVVTYFMIPSPPVLPYKTFEAYGVD